MADSPFTAGGGHPDGSPRQRLTGEQAAVLTGYAHGRDTPEIARQMQITVNAVRSHLKDAVTQLTAVNPTNAVHIATHLQLIPSQGASSVQQGKDQQAAGPPHPDA